MLRSYSDGVFSMSNGDYGIYRYPTGRQEYADGMNMSGKIDFDFEPNTQNIDGNHQQRLATDTIVNYRNADSTILRSELHRFWGTARPANPPSSDSTTFAAWWPGLEFHSEAEMRNGGR